MKTSTQIIEEAADEISDELWELLSADRSSMVSFRREATKRAEKWIYSPSDFKYKNVDRKTMYNWIRTKLESTLSQAMKTAVEEVTPEEVEITEEMMKYGWGNTFGQGEKTGRNDAISEMEEKKRKFFEE
jgi:hypothetical protein